MMARAERRDQHRRAIEQNIFHRGAQALPDDVRIAPQRWRGDSRWRRRQVTSREREHPSDKKLGRPGGKSDRSPGLQHAQHFADRDFRPRRKDMAELAQDHIESRVAKGQFFDVPFVPIDFDSGDSRILPRPLQQFGSEVEPGDASAEARRRDRNDARPARHVQHALSGADARALYQPGRAGRGDGLKRREVHPPCFCAALKDSNGSIRIPRD